MKLDRLKLPPGVSFDRKEGLYAELGPEGQVIHLSVYENGQRKPNTYALDVAPDGSWARVEGPAAAPDSGDTELLEVWVQIWSMWVSKGARDSKGTSPSQAKDSAHPTPKCSFCGKRQDEVAQLVAGPKVYICNECIGLCNDMLAEFPGGTPSK